MPQATILAAAQRAYETSDKRLIMSFAQWLKVQQNNFGLFWGIPQEGENE